MRYVLYILIFLFPALAYAQFPANPRKQQLGIQTTADGLVYRASGPPFYTPASSNDAFKYIDTETGDEYVYNSGWIKIARKSDAMTRMDTTSQINHGFSVGDPVWYTGGQYVLARDTGLSVSVSGIVIDSFDANTFYVQRNGIFTLTGHGFTVDQQLYVQPDGSYSVADTSNLLIYGFPINENDIQIGQKIGGESIRNYIKNNAILGATGDDTEIAFFGPTNEIITDSTFRLSGDSLLAAKAKFGSVINPLGGSDEIGAVNDSSYFNQSRSVGGHQRTTAAEYIVNADTLKSRNHVFLNLIYNTPILNKTVGAQRAYSLRLLNTDYAGPILTIRNNANTDTLNVYAIDGELDITSITTFAAGARAYVKRWWDQSGNGNHVTQTTTTNQPEIANASGAVYTINSNPTVFFSGDYLLDPNFEMDGSALSAVLVSYRTTTGVWYPFSYGNLGSVYGGGFNALRSDGGGTYSQSKGQNGTGGSPVILSKYGNSINAQYINMFSLGVDSVQTWTNDTINPITSSSKGLVQDFESPSNTNFCVGCNSSTLGNTTSNGYIQELIIWNTQQHENQSLIFDELNGFYNTYTGDKAIVHPVGENIILPVPSQSLVGKKVSINFTATGSLDVSVLVADTSVIVVNNIELDSLVLNSGINSNSEFEVVQDKDGEYKWKMVNTTDPTIIPQLDPVFISTTADFSNRATTVGQEFTMLNGARYRVVSVPNPDSPIDGIGQLAVKGGNYVRIEPINGVVKASWFKSNPRDSAHIYTVRALLYNRANSDVSTVLYDTDDVFYDSIRIPEGTHLTSPFNGATQTAVIDTIYRIVVDLQDSTKSFITFENGGGVSQSTGIKLSNLNIQVLSDCGTVINMSNPYDATIEEVYIRYHPDAATAKPFKYGYYLENTTNFAEIWGGRVEGARDAALWMHGGNTLRIYNTQFKGNDVHWLLTGGGAEITGYSNSFEESDSSAIISVGSERLRIHDAYFEGTPTTTNSLAHTIDLRNCRMFLMDGSHPSADAGTQTRFRGSIFLDTVRLATLSSNLFSRGSVFSTCNTKAIQILGNAESGTTKLADRVLANICNPDVVNILGQVDYDSNRLPYNRIPVLDQPNGNSTNQVSENTVLKDTLYTSGLILKGRSQNLVDSSEAFPPTFDANIVLTENAFATPDYLGGLDSAETIQYLAAIASSSAYHTFSVSETMKAGKYYSISFWARKLYDTPASCRFLIRDNSNSVSENTARIADTIYRQYFVRLKMVTDQSSFVLRHSSVTDTMTIAITGLMVNEGYWPITYRKTILAGVNNTSPSFTVSQPLDIQGGLTNADSLKWTIFTPDPGDTVQIAYNTFIRPTSAGIIYLDDANITGNAYVKVMNGSGITTLSKVGAASPYFVQYGQSSFNPIIVGTGSVKSWFYEYDNGPNGAYYLVEQAQVDVPVMTGVTVGDTVVVYKGHEIAIDGASGSYTVELDVTQLLAGETFNIKILDITASTVTLDVLDEDSVIVFEGDAAAATVGFTDVVTGYRYLHCRWDGSLLYITR